MSHKGISFFSEICITSIFLDLIKKFSGRINHIHLIDSDNTCHKDENGNDETSAHPPFGEGILNFDEIVPELAKENIGHDW